jgi:hypothetical protein
MNKYILALRLDELAAEGQILTTPTFPNNRDRVRVWFANAIDTTVFLGAESELRRLLILARDDVEKTEVATLPTRALDIIHKAAGLNRVRRDEGMITEIRNDINAIALETYAKSWPFRVTLAALFATFGFAILGIVQLNNLRVDVRERAEAAAKKAEQEINEQKAATSKAIASLGSDARQEVEKQLRLELQAHVTETKRAITTAAQAHIENLQRQKAPELEAALIISRMNVEALQRRINQSQEKIAELEARVTTLSRGVDQMRATVRGSSTLDRLGAFLDRSRGYVAGEIIALTIALALSAFAMGFTIYKHRND